MKTLVLSQYFLKKKKSKKKNLINGWQKEAFRSFIHDGKVKSQLNAINVFHVYNHY
jgi:hypothetical protein